MDSKKNFLIITATEVESQAVIAVFKSATGKTPRLEDRGGRVYHYLGEISNKHIYLTLSEMGAIGLGASQQAANQGIISLKPDAVIMVGIAFGIDKETQKIGTVLVSTQLCLYELQRVGKNKIARGDIPHASSKLLNYFRSVDLYRNKKEFDVLYGAILTGEKLVDDSDYCEQLKAISPNAIGGEMEGAGVYAACHDNKVDWILVKGICDWADGHKADNKEARQRLAATNAATYVLDTLVAIQGEENSSGTDNTPSAQLPTSGILKTDKGSHSSFNFSNPLLWTISNEEYTASGGKDTFAWSDEIFEGDITISVDIESDHVMGEGVIVVYGDGVKWSQGCLIFNITSDSQHIRAHTPYAGAEFLSESNKKINFIDHKYTLTIEIADDKATMYLDGEKIVSTFLSKKINRKGRVGLFKYWERPQVTYSNIKIRENKVPLLPVKPGIKVVGALSGNCYGNKEMDQQFASVKLETSKISEMSNNILSTNDKPGSVWKEIRMIDFAVWFGGEGIDYFYLIFKSTSGIIKGKVRIKGAGDEIHPFSTQVNSSVPIPMNNLLIKEKGHYQKLPIIEYTITEKSNFDATLTIVMTDIHAVGERTAISLQRPPSIKESKNH